MNAHAVQVFPVDEVPGFRQRNHAHAVREREAGTDLPAPCSARRHLVDVAPKREDATPAATKLRRADELRRNLARVDVGVRVFARPSELRNRPADDARANLRRRRTHRRWAPEQPRSAEVADEGVLALAAEVAVRRRADDALAGLDVVDTCHRTTIQTRFIAIQTHKNWK